MPLENASYITNLNAAYPAGGDKKGQGDDHIRLLKTVLRNTFPKLDGAIQLSAAELNAAAHNITSLNALFGNGEQAVSSAVFAQGMTQQKIRLGWHNPTGRVRALIGGTTSTGGFLTDNLFEGGNQVKAAEGRQLLPGNFHIEVGYTRVNRQSTGLPTYVTPYFTRKFSVVAAVFPVCVTAVGARNPEIVPSIHGLTNERFNLDIGINLGVFEFRWVAFGWV